MQDILEECKRIEELINKRSRTVFQSQNHQDIKQLLEELDIYIRLLSDKLAAQLATNQMDIVSKHLELLQKYKIVLEKSHLSTISENFQMNIKHPLSSSLDFDSDYQPIEAEYVIIRKLQYTVANFSAYKQKHPNNRDAYKIYMKPHYAIYQPFNELRSGNIYAVSCIQHCKSRAFCEKGVKLTLLQQPQENGVYNKNSGRINTYLPFDFTKYFESHIAELYLLRMICNAYKLGMLYQENELEGTIVLYFIAYNREIIR